MNDSRSTPRFKYFFFHLICTASPVQSHICYVFCTVFPSCSFRPVAEFSPFRGRPHWAVKVAQWSPWCLTARRPWVRCPTRAPFCAEFASSPPVSALVSSGLSATPVYQCWPNIPNESLDSSVALLGKLVVINKTIKRKHVTFFANENRSNSES